MIPTRVRIGLHRVSASKFHIVGPLIPVWSRRWRRRRPDRRRIHHRRAVLALAVLHNIAPAVAITVGVLALVDFDQPNFKLLAFRFGWGLIAMAGFLGSLEYVLEEGPQYEWLCRILQWRLRHGLSRSRDAFFWRVLTVEEPIVDIRASTIAISAWLPDLVLGIGIGLYGLTYMYPRYPPRCAATAR